MFWPWIEYMRCVRRTLKLSQHFLTTDFILPDEDRPYLTPDAKVGTTPKVEIYSDDGVKLFRYIPTTGKQYETPLVLVYALINKPYILDLSPERSIVRKFLDRGFDVYLIQWDNATIADQFSLEHYVDIFLKDFLEYIKDYTGSDSVSMLGYCMGGGLAAIYSSLYPENVRNLIFLAATLYFDKSVGGLSRLSDKRFFNPEDVVSAFGYVPAWFLTERFKMLRPLDNYITKYISMFINAENEEFLEDFFRMEKWIHDGVNVAPGAYTDYVKLLYQENALAEGRLFIYGKRVDPKNITMPVAAVVGDKDHLAPPENTLKFLDVIGSKDKAVFRANVGHVGLAVSRRAMEMWDEVAGWLASRSGKQVKAKKI